MKLKKYLNERGKQSWLASQVGTVDSCIHDWKTGRAPVPVKSCVAIEKATGGAVTRKDLRPDDWMLIWPELVEGKS